MACDKSESYAVGDLKQVDFPRAERPFAVKNIRRYNVPTTALSGTEATMLREKALIILLALVNSSVALAAEPKLLLRSGRYAFQHKFAEQPNVHSILLSAKITGRHIVLVNDVQSEVFPKGVIADGTLMWHSKTKQWIIGQNKSDRHARDVGGCSDGPEVVDLEKRVYWTC